MTKWFELAETEFTHLRGNDASKDDKFCGRAAGCSYVWGPPNEVFADKWAGTTPLSRAWRALATWCVELAKPEPKSVQKSENRLAAAHAAVGAIMTSMDRQLGEDLNSLDFQAFAIQLTPDAMATRECMVHAARSANLVATRLEKEQLGRCRAKWRQGLLKGKALAKNAYNYAKASTL